MQGCEQEHIGELGVNWDWFQRGSCDGPPPSLQMLWSLEVIEQRLDKVVRTVVIS